jgi:hypothetical protein
MRIRKTALARRNSGQSLVETVLMMPALLALVLNAVNFGYLFLVVLNLTSASRAAIQYAIIGSQTPGATVLPPAGPPSSNTSVSYLPFQDMLAFVEFAQATNATIQVCSAANGVNGTGASQVANCVSCTSSSSGTLCGGVVPPPAGEAPSPDPEAPRFVLNRVDVTYTFSPLIPGTPFNIVVLAACGTGNSCTFHRQVSMRAMN